MSLPCINSLRLLNKSLNQWYPVGSILLNINNSPILATSVRARATSYNGSGASVGAGATSNNGSGAGATSNNGSELEKIYLGSPAIWRKPPGLPRAPSKLYIITHRKRHPPDETAEVLRIYNNYRFYQRSIQNYLQKENAIREEKYSSEMGTERNNVEHQELMEINRLENERMAKLRKERAELEEQEMIKSILAFKAQEEEREAKDLEASYQRLRETEEQAKLFIDPEDFEKAISDAIDNPVDYNYAVDMDGRKYEGRWTQPHKVDIDTLPVFPVKDEGVTNAFEHI